MANVDFLPNVKTATGFDALNTVSTYINHTARTVTTNGDTYEINVPAPNDILTGQFVLIFVPDSDSIVCMKISINNGVGIPIDGVGAGSLQNGVATSLLVDGVGGVAYSVDAKLDTKAEFKNGTDTFTSGGTTYTVTDAFITIDTLVTVIPTSVKLGNWTVESSNGSFTITSDVAEPSSVTFDWGAVK